MNYYGGYMPRRPSIHLDGVPLHIVQRGHNHVHLLVTPDHADAIPRLIIALGRRYVQYINTAYRRTGTLWDSRYISSLIQAETYLLSCQRYIELNPVRAAMLMTLPTTAGPAIAITHWGPTLTGTASALSGDWAGRNSSAA